MYTKVEHLGCDLELWYIDVNATKVMTNLYTSNETQGTKKIFIAIQPQIWQQKYQWQYSVLLSKDLKKANIYYEFFYKYLLWNVYTFGFFEVYELYKTGANSDCKNLLPLQIENLYIWHFFHQSIPAVLSLALQPRRTQTDQRAVLRCPAHPSLEGGPSWQLKHPPIQPDYLPSKLSWNCNVKHCWFSLSTN